MAAAGGARGVGGSAGALIKFRALRWRRRRARMRVPAFARRQVVSLSSTALALLVSSAGPLRAPAEAPAAAPAPAALPETYPDPNKRNRGMMNEKVLVPRDYYGVFGVVPPRVLVQVDAKQPQWNAWGSCVDNSCTYVPLKQRYHGWVRVRVRARAVIWCRARGRVRVRGRGRGRVRVRVRYPDPNPNPNPSPTPDQVRRLH